MGVWPLSGITDAMLRGQPRPEQLMWRRRVLPQFVGSEKP